MYHNILSHLLKKIIVHFLVVLMYNTQQFATEIFLISVSLFRNDTMTKKPTLKEIIKQHKLTVKDAVPPFTDVPITVREAMVLSELRQSSWQSSHTSDKVMP